MAALRQVAHALLLIVAVLVLNFLLIRLAPGDAAEVIAGESGATTPGALAAIRENYGLTEPLHVQVVRYLGHLVQGDFGYSYFFNQPVITLVFDRVGATLLLAGAAFVLAMTGGTLLGVLAARRPNGWLSHSVMVFSLAGFAAPVFWTGMLLLIAFGVEIPVFPTYGMESTLPAETFLGRAGDIAHHLVLPALTLGLAYLAVYARTARASMVDVLGSDYVRTAWAKGLSERSVVAKHALRNALLPVVTLAGLQFGNLLSGAVLVETVFDWPGLGTLAVDSILRRDTPVLLGILLLASVLTIVANLLTDLSYRVIDPRIRVGGG